MSDEPKNIRKLKTEFIPPETRALYAKWEHAEKIWKETVTMNMHLICAALESGQPFLLRGMHANDGFPYFSINEMGDSVEADRGFKKGEYVIVNSLYKDAGNNWRIRRMTGTILTLNSNGVCFIKFDNGNVMFAPIDNLEKFRMIP